MSVPEHAESTPNLPAGTGRGYSATRPRLHRGHFAFLRGVVQGLAPRVLWVRYLADQGDADDTPRVRRITAWIRHELAAAAVRGGGFGRARLLRLDLAPQGDEALPTLDEFVAALGLEDFSEADQSAYYTAHYGLAAAREQHRTVLLRRQLWAIHMLEEQLAQPVCRGDGCEAWFIDALAQRLAAGGIGTLGDLHARVAQGGAWWRGLRGIGLTKATTLARFVAAHAETLGPLPSASVERAEGSPPIALPAPDDASLGGSPLMPLDRLTLPGDLDGHAGRFRAPREHCLLEADSDAAAIAAWVATKAKVPRERPRQQVAGAGKSQLSRTQRGYKKEGERLLLWAVLERRKPLSSLTLEDANAYRDFLLAPPPAWCGRRAQPRWKATWRPLAGALSPRSCTYALGAVANLFGFLVDQGYLVGNPWRGVSRPCEVPRGPNVHRGFTREQWRYLCEELAALPAGLAAQRLQVALHLLYDTGLRIAELVGANCDDLRWETLVGASGVRIEGWWLSVIGKGGRVRQVPVPGAWIALLSPYLVARGAPADPRQALGVALLGNLSARSGVDGGKGGISASSLHRQLKRFFGHCAARLGTDDPVAAAALRRASCHWMRHTHVSHALEAGVPVQTVQKNVGHASLDTTTGYVHTEDASRYAAMQAFWTA